VNSRAMKQGMAAKEGEQEEEGRGGGGEGNCCENYRTSTLQRNRQQYLRNMCVMNAQNDLESIWMSLEYRQNFLVNAKRQSKSKQKRSSKDEQLESGSTRQRFDGNLDIDDDGLIGYVDEAKVAANNNGSEEVEEEERNEEGDRMHDDVDDDGFACYHENALQADYGIDDARDSSFTALEELQNIELISYVNNFSLKNSFSWTLGTLMQSTSDLYPKVLNCTDTSHFLFLYCSRAVCVCVYNLYIHN
jgi:hypothetical protein